MSSGEHQITVNGFDQEKEDKEMFSNLQVMQEQNDISRNGQGQGRNQVPTIQRVSEVMKAGKHQYWKKYFKPNAIAIGPIRADSKNLLVGKDLKLKWAAKYLDGLDQEKILKKIRGEIESLMGHFDEKCLKIRASRDEYMNSTLARMLFVDGCAMLQFIYSFVWDDFVKHLEINAAQATLVQQDLFLLENQIPFRVLQIIMNEGKNKQQEEKEQKYKNNNLDSKKLTKTEKAVQISEPKQTTIEAAVQVFIHLCNMSTASQFKFSLQLDGAVHLLDLLRRSLLDDSPQSDDSSDSDFNRLPPFSKFIYVILMSLFVIVTTLLVLTIVIVLFVPLFCMVVFRLASPKSPIPVYDPLLFVPFGGIIRRSFRNVQEMKAAGIELKPRKSMALKDVKFSSGWFGGCLQLCPILLDKSTAGMLLSLIAYEMCLDYHCRTTENSKMTFRISSYLSFLDSLIDGEQDVKDLRAANILRHRFGSDKEVADLFNNISHISGADDAYGKVFSDMQEYHKKKIQILMTELNQEYLRSPWKLLALIAAVAALGLTATQTYFTINPR